MTWQLEKLLQEHDAKLSSGDKEAVTDRSKESAPRPRVTTPIR